VTQTKKAAVSTAKCPHLVFMQSPSYNLCEDQDRHPNAMRERRSQQRYERDVYSKPRARPQGY
jgi:hypothetical protein